MITESDSEACAISLPAASTRPVRSVTTQVERGETITRIAYMDGTSARYRADGSALGPLSELEARLIVADGVIGGDDVISTTQYAAADVPFDFRRPLPVWQGCRTLGTGELLLLNPDHPDSLDGRYFGPLPASAVIGRATPLHLRAPAAPPSPPSEKEIGHADQYL